MASKKVSSGAQKAENLTEAKKATNGKGKMTESVKTETKSSAKKKTPTKAAKAQTSHAKKAKRERKENKLSEKRQRAKQLREEKMQARSEKRAERRQLSAERKAERQERKQLLKAEKQERRDLLRSESKSERADRKAKEKQLKREAVAAKRKAAADERQLKREHRLKIKAERRAARNDKRHAPGFGGWLAAVISLGVTTLALGTIVTFGWLGMSGMQATMSDGQAQTLYELNSVIDNLDANLSKARAATSSSDRVKLFSDIAIESEMAEVMLERLPLDITMTEEMASFINKMSDSAQDMLYTSAVSGELTPSQQKSLEYMYATNKSLKNELNGIVANYKSEDMFAVMRGKGSVLGESFTNIQNNVIEEPKGIQDGPFSDSVKTEGAKSLEGLKEITAHKAEQLAEEYFADFHPTQINCTGEAVANSLTCYNVNIATADGDMLAQFTKNGGKLVMFDSFKDCTEKNFSLENCTIIAEEFLSGLGYNNLKAVWTSENGTTCNLNFAPVVDGVVIYPDLIKVKVCEERGLVTGIEAMSYCLNHTERNLESATISKSAAQSSICGDIQVEGARLTLIPLRGEEVLAYEFYGSMDGNDYYVYVDAKTGEEVEVLTVIGTAQGRALM
jgi:germination protein YpeB